MPIQPIVSTGLPGTYILEATFGSVPKGLNSHNDCYMLGYATQGATDTPVFCSTYDDFVTVFGSGSASSSSVQMYFAQRPGNGLYFVNVRPRVTRSLTIPTITAGATYSVTIDGYTASVVATATDTQTSLLASLKQKLGTEAPNLGSIVSSQLRTSSAAVVSATANITVGTTVAAASYPVAQDVIDSAIVAFDDDQLGQGFLIAPEFFNAFVSNTELATLASGIESICSDPSRYWMGLIDCSAASATAANVATAVSLAKAERSSITSAKGHILYYFPHVINGSGVRVPPSSVVAGVAIRTFRETGYRTPAGKELKTYNCASLSFNVTDRIQTQINPLGINCLRAFRREGVCIYGARTASTSPFYTYFLVRLVLNILARTVSDALDIYVFRTIDGEAAAMGAVKATAADICEDLRTAGLLFGATAVDAYRIVCDSTNNSGLDLDNGALRVKIFVKPSATAEVILIELYRASLSSPLQEQTTIDTTVQDPQGTKTNAGKVN